MRRPAATTWETDLALSNNRFMVRHAEHFATRLQASHGTPGEQVALAFRLALGRRPRPDELESFVAVAATHGLETVCRTLFNCNEFLFVD